ncbi:uncharacterized protein C8R40DRAFT_1080094 [Lentinula edodes]|uniref:uncharacterized protein n=1 Tax=Lentinula edodes TaxID=5353 RepID=UPI001E8EE90B|nr:uncharacterized protein C8R40DRAFT_1080094 [Lentinula edodes]KAH7880410.1 hypothetical protein C8R40DRAFT_1080094 [Lentinula edodes]
MIFRDILLQLVIGTCFLRTLSTAASIPQGRSIVSRKRDFGIQVSTKTNPSVRSLTSSEVHFVKKRDDEKWFKQLEASFNRRLKTCDSIDQFKKVFWIDYSPTRRWEWCKGYGQPVFGNRLIFFQPPHTAVHL